MLLFCFLAGGCASPKVAKRFSGIDPRFPPHRYLIGVGEGESEAEATRRAYAAISMQLRAELEATERVEASSVRTHAAEGFSESESLAQEIRVKTRFDRMDWIQVADVASEDGRFQVLCVLDREQAGAELDAEIEEDLAFLRPRLATLEEATALGALSRGLQPLRETGAALRTKLALRFALGRRGGPGSAELRAIRDLEGRLEGMRRSATLRLCVATKGVKSGALELERGLGASLAATGWAVAPCDEGPGLRLDGVLRAVADAHNQAGGYPWFCATSLVFRVVDPETGRAELGGTKRSRRSGGMSPADACRASLGALAAGVAAVLEGADPEP